MKKLFLIFFSILTIAIGYKYFNFNYTSVTKVLSLQGKTDLSGIDFSKTIIALNGEWKFYWKNLVPISADTREPADNSGYINVPQSWNSAVLRGEKLFPREGFATYTMEIKTKETGKMENYAIYLNRISSAYRVFINGDLMLDNGMVGRNKNEVVPHRQTRMIHFGHYSDGSPIVIAIQVSNYHHVSAGIKNAILFGSAARITEIRIRYLLIDVFTLSILLAAAVYLISISFFRDSEKSYLNLGLFLLFLCLFVAGSGENVLMSVFPELNWHIFMKLLHISLGLPVLFYNLFLDNLYREQSIKVISLFISTVSVAFCLLVLISPVAFFVLLLPVFHIVISIALLYNLLFLAFNIKRKKDGAAMIFTGLAAFAITAVLEILYVNEFATNPRILPVGILVLAFSYIIASSSRYAVISKQFDNLSSRDATNTNKLIVIRNIISEPDGLTDVAKIRRDLRKISYIKSNGLYCAVFDDNGKNIFDVSLPLKYIIVLFGSDETLFRCSKSYIVNPSKVTQIKKASRNRRYNVILVNGHTVPASKVFLQDSDLFRPYSRELTPL